jgi:acyl-CoA thioesterase FadM
VEINLAITSVGESSLSYEVRVEREGETAASGRIIIVLIDRETGSSIPWPTHIRELLLAGADPA